MKIGIFTAMDKEAKSFLQHGATKIRVGNFDIYSLKLSKHKVFLCCPPSVGEIAAASACQLLISKFKVDVILNFGVVGALTQKTSVASTVFVGSVVHYAMDLSAIDNVPQGRYSCFDDIAVDCDLKLIEQALRVEYLPVVRCASADVFVADEKDKTALRQNYGAEICDMESAGVLFTCKFNKIPCLMVKCVSDSLTGGSGEYERNAQMAANGFFDFASRLAKLL